MKTQRRSITKKQLLRIISQETGVSLKNTGTVVEGLISIISENLPENSLRFKHFGSFKAVAPSVRKDGKRSHWKLKFRPNREFKHCLNAVCVLPYDQGIKQITEHVKENKNTHSKYIEQGKKTPKKNSKTPLITNHDIPDSGVTNGLNDGQRVEIDTVIKNYSECIGQVTYEVDKLHFNKLPNSYPIILLPDLGSDIFSRVETKHGRQGVCDSFLYEEIVKIFDSAQLNSAIFLRDSAISAEPDISLFFDNSNLLIDIEVDEPYDGLSRSPLHYAGCNDNIRNELFRANGWAVIRFSERQVRLNPLSCIKLIASVVDNLLNMQFGELFEHIPNIETEELWSFEQANYWASDNYREDYLGLEFTLENKSEGFNTDYKQEDNLFVGKPTSIKDAEEELSQDNLQISDKLSTIDIIKLAIANSQFLSFKYGEEEYTTVLLPLSITENTSPVKFDGQLEESFFGLTYVVDFVHDLKVVGGFATLTLENPNELTAYETLHKASLHGNLVKILYYTAGSGKTQWRVLKGITFLYYLNFFGLHAFPNYQEYRMNLHRSDIVFSKEYIYAYCMLRNEMRQFKLDRILSIQVLSNKYCHFDLDYLIPEFYNTSSYRAILAKEFDKAVNNAHASLFYKPNKLTAKGNLAHALFFQGVIEDSIELYRRHMGEEIESGMLWEDMIEADILEFSAVGINTNELSELVKSLKNK